MVFEVTEPAETDFRFYIFPFVELGKCSSQRVRRQLFPLFRWWLCSAAMPSIRRYSAASKCEFRSQFPLLPLYSANGLRRQVVADAADARNFGGNACSDVLQQRPVKLGNFSGQNVNGVDAANDAGRLLEPMQSSFEFGWNALLLARCISHICYLYPVGNIFPDWVMHLLRN